MINLKFTVPFDQPNIRILFSLETSDTPSGIDVTLTGTGKDDVFVHATAHAYEVNSTEVVGAEIVLASPDSSDPLSDYLSGKVEVDLDVSVPGDNVDVSAVALCERRDPIALTVE